MTISLSFLIVKTICIILVLLRKYFFFCEEKRSEKRIDVAMNYLASSLLTLRDKFQEKNRGKCQQAIFLFKNLTFLNVKMTMSLSFLIVKTICIILVLLRKYFCFFCEEKRSEKRSDAAINYLA